VLFVKECRYKKFLIHCNSFSNLATNIAPHAEL